MTRPELLIDKTVLEYKVCMHCGHLQNPSMGMCEKCGAGKIGLGKPREFWAYLNLKIEGRITLPDAGFVSQFKEELVTGILENKGKQP